MKALSELLKAAQEHGSTMTVEEAYNQWVTWLTEASGLSQSTIHNAATYVKDWMREAGSKDLTLDKVDQKLIYQWANNTKRPVKALTRRFMIWALRQFLHFCSANGWVKGNQARLVRVRYDTLTHQQKETRKRIPFNDAEVARILAATKPGGSCDNRFWYIATAIGRHTGLRLIDIATLEWASFAKPNKIIVWTAKKDRRVELPMRPRVLADAVGMIDIVDQRYCFPEQARIALSIKRRALLSVQFGSILKKLGITGKSFHCLRYSFIQEMQAEGIPIEHIAVAAGHASPTTTRGYMR